MPFWCARLQAGRTGLALHLLQQFGYQAYYPRILNGRGVPEGLFAHYIFIGVQIQWAAVQYCPGVAHVIGTRGAPPDQVADALVELIRRREGSDGLIRLPEPPKSRGLRRGDRVRIREGPFANRIAVYAGMSGAQRVAVLLTLFSSEKRVTLSKDAIAAL